MSLDPKSLTKSRYKGASMDRMAKGRTINIIHEGRTWQFEQVDDANRIDTPMKIDWRLDKERYRRSYRAVIEDPVLVKMHPMTFLEIQPISSEYVSEESLISIRKGLKDGSVFNTPRLVLNRKGEVINHEGRHRAMVLLEMGATEMPVAIVKDYHAP